MYGIIYFNNEDIDCNYPFPVFNSDGSMIVFNNINDADNFADRFEDYSTEHNHPIETIVISTDMVLE